MKIVFLVSSMNAGGAERVAATLVNAWADQGHDVTLLVCHPKKTPSAYALDSRVQLQHLLDESPLLGLRFIGSAIKPFVLRQTLKRLQPDRIVSFLTNVNVVALVANWGLKRPIIVCERTHPTLNESSGKFLRVLRRLLYPRATAVVAQTEQSADVLRRLLPSQPRVHSIPNPLPPELLTLDKASGQPDAQGRYQLVAMGRLVPSKQFDVLIRAFAAVASNFPNWNLSIWGEGPLHASLQQQIQQSGLQQRIQLMGHSKQAFQQLQQATAFVLTSRVEGFPNVLLEAMALGLPCISFDCPSGPAELSADGQAALLVPLNNLARLQQALAEIMADANLRAQLSDRARRWVLAQYPLSRVLEQWQALLAEPQAVQPSGTGLYDDASGVHKQTKPLHVVHIISGLGQGGAETVLYRLSSAPSSEFRHTVISMSSAGEFSERFRQAGVPLYTLGMPWGRLTITGLWRLYRLLKSQQPDVVQTWMYYADLIGGVMARLAGIKAVSWGVRNSGQYLHLSSRVARLMAWCCARVSPWVPAQIVSCSEAAAVRHVQWGYSADKMRVIANGYDLNLWRPDAQSRQRVRRELGIDEHTPLIGTVGRWNPQKDHANLLQALALVKTHWPQLRCALIGLGLEADNQALAAQLTQFGLQENVLLLGQRSDVPALMNALDLHVLPSRAEAFPNVVAEAMACGVPCVATDVGDAAAIVASYGWLVPPQNPQALAQAIEQALNQLGSTALKQRVEGGRQHIQQTFSLTAMSKAYQRLWRKLTLAKPAASGLRVLMVVNNPAFFLSHRLSIALAAQKAGFDVHIATPYDRDVNTIRRYGLTHHTVQLTRSGMNPLVEGLGVWRLWRLFRRVRPDLVHAVTIKPVLYGGLAARLARVPSFVAAISGLGYLFTRPKQGANWGRRLAVMLYRLALRHPRCCVIFQNMADRDLLLDAQAVRQSQAVLIKGSGVDLHEFQVVPEPQPPITVVMAARLLADKGVREFAQAARYSLQNHDGICWRLAGSPDPGNPGSIAEQELTSWHEEGVLEWVGECHDVASFYQQAHIVVLPSYREGLPKSLIEAAACGRAVVTTDVPGCRDAIWPDKSGLLVPLADAQALYQAVKQLANDTAQRQQMGHQGRRLAEAEFDVQHIIKQHLRVYQRLTTDATKP